MNSEVKIFFIGFSGQRLHVMTSNEGDRPAAILKTWLQLNSTKEYITMQSAGPAGEIHENPSSWSNVSTNEKARADQLQNATNGCVLGIEVVSFRGKRQCLPDECFGEVCHDSSGQPSALGFGSIEMTGRSKIRPGRCRSNGSSDLCLS